MHTHTHKRAQLFEVDEGVEIVSELVEEVCEVAFSIVYSHYLEEQAFPHSVDDAKHSLLKIIEVRQLGAKYKGRDVLYRTENYKFTKKGNKGHPLIII